jgi:hypothetical protein
VTEIIGLLPMGGKGTRLGTLAPKPLMPTITDAGIVPLYEHALGRLHEVTNTIYSLVHADSCSCIRRVPLPSIETAEWELPGALADAAFQLALLYDDPLILMAFPDSIWHTEHPLTDVIDRVRGDGAVALFDARADELDWVDHDDERVNRIVTKTADATGGVRGWGAFVVRAEALIRFRADEKDGPQLGQLDLGWVYLGEYADLGTPERYIRHHDQRERGSDLQPARAGLAPGVAA